MLRCARRQVPGERCQATGGAMRPVPGDRCQATGANSISVQFRSVQFGSVQANSFQFNSVQSSPIQFKKKTGCVRTPKPSIKQSSGIDVTALFEKSFKIVLWKSVLLCVIPFVHTMWTSSTLQQYINIRELSDGAISTAESKHLATGRRYVAVGPKYVPVGPKYVPKRTYHFQTQT